MTARYTVAGPEVIQEYEDGETLLIHLSTGCYYSFKRGATEAWQEFCRGASLAQVCAGFAERYPGEESGEESIQASCEEFLNFLCDENLLRAVDAAHTPVEEPPADESKACGRSAQDDCFRLDYEKYEDLKSLLLVDPIHEIRLVEPTLDSNEGNG